MKNELSLQRGQGWSKGRLPPSGISSWPGPRLGPADRHEFNKTRRGGQKVYIWLDGYIYPSRKEAGKYVKHTSGRRENMQPTRGVSSSSATCCSHVALQSNRNCLAEAGDTGYRGNRKQGSSRGGGLAGDKRQEA